MKENLFGEKINYEELKKPFVLVGLLKRFDNRYQSAADNYFKETGWARLFFLKGITLFKQPPSIQDMANFIGCSHQNANKQYSKLLKDGYLTSKQDENDRRKQRLYLTQKGEAFLLQNQFGKGETVPDIFSVLTEKEIDTAIEIIYKLTKKMEEI